MKFRESRAQWLIQGRVVCKFLILWVPCGLGLEEEGVPQFSYLINNLLVCCELSWERKG